MVHQDLLTSNAMLIVMLSHLAWLTGLPCPSRANKDYTILYLVILQTLVQSLQSMSYFDGGLTSF